MGCLLQDQSNVESIDGSCISRSRKANLGYFCILKVFLILEVLRHCLESSDPY